MLRSSSFLFTLLAFLPSLSNGFAVAPLYTRTAFPKDQIIPIATRTAHDEETGKNAAGQDWDVDLYQNKHSFVWEYGASLVDLLDPQPGERILDVGCGSGELAQKISERGADVVGIDADPQMIETAAAKFPGIVFRCADASKLEQLSLDNDDSDGDTSTSFDAIFSNAALHWVTDAEAAVAGMACLLKPGGRFVVEFGGRGNVESIVETSLRVVRETVPEATAKTSWYFPGIPEYASLLEAHGIEVISAALYDRPTILEDGDSGMKHWLEMFGDGLFRGLSQEEKETVIYAVVDKLRKSTHLYDRDKGKWTADYRRIRIVGEKMMLSS